MSHSPPTPPPNTLAQVRAPKRLAWPVHIETCDIEKQKGSRGVCPVSPISHYPGPNDTDARVFDKQVAVYRLRCLSATKMLDHPVSSAPVVLGHTGLVTVRALVPICSASQEMMSR